MSIKTSTGNEGIREQTDNKLFVGLIIRRNVRPQSVTILTSATAIPTTALTYRKTLMILNISTNVVYIGDSGVTTSNGFPLYPRAQISISIEDDIILYGISTGSSEIRILEGA